MMMMMMTMTMEQHYGETLRLERKASKSDLEKTKTIDISGHPISEKYSRNQKDGQVSVILSTSFSLYRIHIS